MLPARDLQVGSRPRVRHRALRYPSFESFLSLTRALGAYRPGRQAMMQLYDRLCRYAKALGVSIRKRDLRDWWNLMLEWRRWASGNPDRAKRFPWRSLRGFLQLGVAAVQVQSTQFSTFPRFHRAMRDYYQRRRMHCPPFSAVLGAYVDLLDASGVSSADDLDIGSAERTLVDLSDQRHPPLKLNKLVGRLAERLQQNATAYIWTCPLF